jgi:hypothetical protein
MGSWDLKWGLRMENRSDKLTIKLIGAAGETTNIASKEPAQVQKMLARLKFLVSPEGGGMVEPQQWVKPYQGESYFCADCPLHPGGKGPATPWLPWLDNDPAADMREPLSNGYVDIAWEQ